MGTPGVDYAWGQPGVRALRAIGEKFVARYLSNDASKNLSRGEAQQLSDGGIWIVVVWESTASRATDGYRAGQQDARDALAQANACGMPGGRPIYFAVDFDGAGPDVKAYFQGAVSVLGADRVGVYGGIRVVSYLLDRGLAKWAWQADAWSYGAWDPRAHIRQGGQHTISGVDCDDDTAMTRVHEDYGQWRIGVTPGGSTPFQPPQEEDDMPYGQLTDGKGAITPISLPKGRYKTIGFIGDNGLQALPPADLRVAISQGGGNWHVIEHLLVDSHKGQAVIVFPDAANTDGISVRREDGGDVHVAWEVS